MAISGICEIVLIILGGISDRKTLFNFIRASKYWYNIFETEDAQRKKYIRRQTLLTVFSEEVKRGECTAGMAVEIITYLMPRAQEDALALYEGAWKGLLDAKEWNQAIPFPAQLVLLFKERQLGHEMSEIRRRIWQQGSWYSYWREDISRIRQNEARTVDDTHNALFKRTFLYTRESGFASFLLLVKHGYIEE
ncbi:hypothetical protein BGZ60DRAFT_569585 [Tricladium varicosporioides]|nr:hypothetical protein BGZ60DRAFT_569585 [Hymenoscyphus varicosporioides]